MSMRAEEFGGGGDYRSLSKDTVDEKIAENEP